MMLSLLAGFCFTQAKTPPLPDRSAEPQLRRLFKDANSISTCHARIRQERRRSEVSMTEMRDTTEFWYAAGPKFNAYTVGNRSIRNICDGKSLMLDPLDDTQPIRLKNAAKSIYAGDKSLSSDRNPMPFYYFLDGDSGFEALVSKSDPIMLKTWPNNEQSIEFSSRAIGRANVFYTDFGKLRLVTRVQFDNLPWLTKMAVENPGDFSQPDPTALTIFNIEYLSVNEKIPDDVFDPTPPNGKQVEDERKKGG